MGNLGLVSFAVFALLMLTMSEPRRPVEEAPLRGRCLRSGLLTLFTQRHAGIFCHSLWHFIIEMLLKHTLLVVISRPIQPNNQDDQGAIVQHRIGIADSSLIAVATTEPL